MKVQNASLKQRKYTWHRHFDDRIDQNIFPTNCPQQVEQMHGRFPSCVTHINTRRRFDTSRIVAARCRYPDETMWMRSAGNEREVGNEVSGEIAVAVNF